MLDDTSSPASLPHSLMQRKWFHKTLHDVVPQGKNQFPSMDHEIELKLTTRIKSERRAEPVECRF